MLHKKCMERTNILVCSDALMGRELSSEIEKLRINVQTVPVSGFASYNLEKTDILIFYIDDFSLAERYCELFNDRRMDGIFKIIISSESFRESFLEKFSNSEDVQFFLVPLNVSEFLFSLEKVVLVDQYKRVLQGISNDSVSRLSNIKRVLFSEDNGFGSPVRDRNFLVDLLDFEKKIIMEQVALNESVREIATLRNVEFSALRDRIEAEEHLEQMRRDELIEARRIIEAQEVLIDHSARELHEANRIIDARETVEELSRNEALSLREEINSLKNENMILKEKIKQLTDSV